MYLHPYTLHTIKKHAFQKQQTHGKHSDSSYRILTSFIFRKQEENSLPRAALVRTAEIRGRCEQSAGCSVGSHSPAAQTEKVDRSRFIYLFMFGVETMQVHLFPLFF